MKINITLGSLYFGPKKVIFKKGTMVEFVSSKGKDINIFKNQGNWTDENIQMVVKTGQAGMVIDFKTVSTTEMTWTEYQIEVDGKIGWVLESDVKASN